MSALAHPRAHLPVIHPNGTPKAVLLEQMAEAIDALEAAARKLAAAAPNARDYYVDPGRMNLAEAVFKARRDMLRGLISALEADLIALDRS